MTNAVEPMTPRGWQRTPKPWPMAVLCRLGIHAGQWRYVIENDCMQGRECDRCGSVLVRTKHQPVWRYIRDGSCEQIRSCAHCDSFDGDHAEKISHEWDETYEVSTRWWQNSKEGHRCLRCRDVQEWSDNSD